MVRITAKLKVPRGAYRIEVGGALRLSFGERRRGALRAALVSGEEVEIALPQGEILRGGDLVAASDGRVIEVIAAPEKLMHVTCATPAELARCAWHLGRRQVPIETGEGFLRLAGGHAEEEMLKKLGAAVAEVEAPFEPGPDMGAGGLRQDDADHRGARRERSGAQLHDHAHDHRHVQEHTGCDHPDHGHVGRR